MRNLSLETPFHLLELDLVFTHPFRRLFRALVFLRDLLSLKIDIVGSDFRLPLHPTEHVYRASEETKVVATVRVTTRLCDLLASQWRANTAKTFKTYYA